MARGPGSGEDPSQNPKRIRTPIQLAGVIVGVAAGIITKSLSLSQVTQIIAAIAAMALLLLGQIFSALRNIPKNSRESLVIRSFQTLCFTWLATIALVMGFKKIWGDENPSEKALIRSGEKLLSLRGHYQGLLLSPGQAPELAKDAAQLVEEIDETNDADLVLDMQIFKYESLAYSSAIIAGCEMIAKDEFNRKGKQKAIEEIFKATEKARFRVEEAHRVQPINSILQAARDWIVKDDAPNRIQRLTAVAFCFRWKLDQVDDDLTKARALIDDLPAYYIAREHPERSYELAPCLNDK